MWHVVCLSFVMVQEFSFSSGAQRTSTVVAISIWRPYLCICAYSYVKIYTKQGTVVLFVFQHSSLC